MLAAASSWMAAFIAGSLAGETSLQPARDSPLDFTPVEAGSEPSRGERCGNHLRWQETSPGKLPKAECLSIQRRVALALGGSSNALHGFLQSGAGVGIPDGPNGRRRELAAQRRI